MLLFKLRFMLTREVKLKVNRKLKKKLESHLYHLTGVYNWAYKQIEHELRDCESRPREIGCLTKEQSETLAELFKSPNIVRLKHLDVNTNEFDLYSKLSGNIARYDHLVSNEAVLSSVQIN